MQRYTVYFNWKLLYMFRVVPPPILRSASNCVYVIWHFSHRNSYLPLSWKSWNRFECAVGSVRHPQHTQTGSNSSTIAAESSNGVTNTRCCRYSCMRSWWWVEVPPETCRAVSRYNELRNVASCCIYIGILKTTLTSYRSRYKVGWLCAPEKQKRAWGGILAVWVFPPPKKKSTVNINFSLIKNFLPFILLNFEISPPKNRYEVQKNVGKNRERGGVGSGGTASIFSPPWGGRRHRGDAGYAVVVRNKVHVVYGQFLYGYVVRSTNWGQT